MVRLHFLKTFLKTIEPIILKDIQEVFITGGIGESELVLFSG